jgi:antitoxin component YwqK of YwqJK toxin-antitoxin module
MSRGDNLITYFTLLFILFSLGVYSQTIENKKFNLKDSLGNRTGKWLYEKDSIPFFMDKIEGFIVAEYCKDTLHGEYLVYDRNEQLRARMVYYKGNKEGLGYTYLQNGSLHEVVSFSNDTFLSRVFFDKKQKIYRIYEYDFDGNLNGREVHFYKNGDMLTLVKWTNGTKQTKINFYKKNRPSAIYNYDSLGKLVETLFYKRNGNLDMRID